MAPVVVAPPVVTPPVVTPPPRVTAFCASTPKETLGADDPFYVNSWHLKNTGPTQAVSAPNNAGVAGIDANTEAVHNGGLGCTGKGIVIAINDSGLELTHEDIAPNLVAGKSFNFLTMTDDPSPPIPQLTTDHGTGVAGVAIARGWNGKGSRGTAPFASVVGYVSANEPTPEIGYLAYGGRSKAGTSALVTQFGNRTDVVDIFNFSAGADFADVAAFEDDDALDSQTDSARVGTQTLRAGKGAVYFQSAGNSHVDYSGQRRGSGPALAVNCATTLAEDAAGLGTFSPFTTMSCGNSNQDPANKPFWYQVASKHNTGRASSYSTAGAANWITGFGGEGGIDDGAAIISTVNSSDKGRIAAIVDFATGARAAAFTANGGTVALALDLPWQTNSAGFNFHNRYGFGLIDATAAVNLAQNYTAPAGRRAANLVKPVTGALATTPVGTQYTRLERQVVFGEAAAVSGMMRVDLAVTNTLATGLNPGKLQFELVNNASGQVSILMPAFTGWYVGGKTDAIPANGVRKFRFHTNAFYGDSLGGAFTVRVTNVGGAVAFTSSLTSYSQ